MPDGFLGTQLPQPSAGKATADGEGQGDDQALLTLITSANVACGGHAGDATPAARLLASQVDNLVLHPNVVNASDINEQAENCLYAEGSLICRLMMGTIGLRKVRQNRVLLVTDVSHMERSFCTAGSHNGIHVVDGIHTNPDTFVVSTCFTARMSDP